MIMDFPDDFTKALPPGPDLLESVHFEHRDLKRRLDRHLKDLRMPGTQARRTLFWHMLSDLTGPARRDPGEDLDRPALAKEPDLITGAAMLRQIPDAMGGAFSPDLMASWNVLALLVLNLLEGDAEDAAPGGALR